MEGKVFEKDRDGRTGLQTESLTESTKNVDNIKTDNTLSTAGTKQDDSQFGSVPEARRTLNQEIYTDGVRRNTHTPDEENALHLHFSSSPESKDIHYFSGSVALSSSDPGPSSQSPVHDSSTQANPVDTHLNIQSESTTSTQTPPRVHFRSRVRIASGRFSHHRPQSQSQAQSGSLQSSQMPRQLPLVVRARRGSSSHHSDFESGDSSPSSSISAPLRSTPEPHERMRPHGSFLYPSPARKYRPKRNLRTANVSGSSGDEPGTLPPSMPSQSSDERAPLLRAPGSRLGARTRRLYGLPDDEASEDSRARKRAQRMQEIRESFGPWPWRLFNGYWWAWVCTPVICCCCPADDDDDSDRD